MKSHLSVNQEKSKTELEKSFNALAPGLGTALLKSICLYVISYATCSRTTPI